MDEEERILISAPDSFIGHVCCIGNAIGVVIPIKLIHYLGIKKGDNVKMWIKKVDK